MLEWKFRNQNVGKIIEGENILYRTVSHGSHMLGYDSPELLNEALKDLLQNSNRTKYFKMPEETHDTHNLKVSSSLALLFLFVFVACFLFIFAKTKNPRYNRITEDIELENIEASESHRPTVIYTLDDNDSDLSQGNSLFRERASPKSPDFGDSHFD
jgi:hypothetical protein